ncbi:hypothetical protein [Streptomyces sp. C]|uniref:hypothetical protein n=1 Tax=Streptomyces sp. C TaxID=253839 RepID=UPI00101B530F
MGTLQDRLKSLSPATARVRSAAGPSDLDWFRDEVRRPYGFSVPGVDYTAPVATEVPWPAPAP